MDPSRVFAYAVAFVTSACGFVVAAGWFVPETVPPQLRITLGVVLVLLGIYRFAITNAKFARTERGQN